MRFGWRQTLLGLAATLSLAAAAQAAEFGSPFGSPHNRPHPQLIEYGEERVQQDLPAYGPRGRYYHRDPAYFDGRPVADHHRWHRPGYGRSGWGYGRGCQVIVTERVNRWGDLIVRRDRVCD